MKTIEFCKFFTCKYAVVRVYGKERVVTPSSR